MRPVTDSNATSRQPALSRPWFLVALIICVSLAGIADHDLWTPDEPREAAIALGMSRTGNLVVPELAGKPFVEKPPLFYITASYSLLGPGKIIGNTAALRLLSAIFGLGTLWFIYLLGKIYFDRQTALIAAAVLATMAGFVHVTHWLLVDNSLMFYIVASIWALARAYESDRLPYLTMAGFLTACAFLTKGFVGPLIITIAWCGLWIPRVKRLGVRPVFSAQSIFHHLLGLLVAVIMAASWVVPFYIIGGEELFHEWWWTNHFGRFSGQAVLLGHISPWYYYCGVLPVYILPWIAPFIIALWVMFKKIWRKETLSPGIVLLAFWIIGTFLMLSLSATKRDIYLSAFLPACALFCAGGLKGQLTGLNKASGILWMTVLFILAAAGILAPFFTAQFLRSPPPMFGWFQIMAMAVIILALLVLRRPDVPFLSRFLAVTLMLSSVLLTIWCPLVDLHKSYRTAFTAAASAVKNHPEIKFAGWNLDETTVAGFFYYSGLTFPLVSDPRAAHEILRGSDPNYNGLVLLTKNRSPKYLPDDENQAIFRVFMGKRRLLELLAPKERHKAKGTE